MTATRKKQPITAVQKKLVSELFNGSYIVHYGNHYRMRDAYHNPFRNLNEKTFRYLKNILRKAKRGYVMDKNAVRKLSGHTWIKKQYKILYRKQVNDKIF